MYTTTATTTTTNNNNDNNYKGGFSRYGGNFLWRRLPRKGTNGVNTNGVTANLVFFDRGIFFGTPAKCVLPKMPGRTFFPILQNSLLLQRPQ